MKTLTERFEACACPKLVQCVLLPVTEILKKQFSKLLMNDFTMLFQRKNTEPQQLYFFDYESVGPTINTEKYGLLLTVDQTMNQNWMSTNLFQQNAEKPNL